MNTVLLAVTGSIYLWIALDYAMSERWGMSLAFVAYALANLGFVLDL